MCVKKNFYSDKKCKYDLLETYLGVSEELDKKILVLIDDIKQGFSLYTKRNLERFIQGYKDIEDFAEQFVILNTYYSNNNKYANTEKLYKILYGETLGKLKWQEKIDKVKGSNNPWYNHGGKLSIFSENCNQYSHLSNEDKKIITEQKKDDLKHYKDANPWMYGKMKIEYWIKKGYSEEESKQKVKESSNTFTLEKQIKKHGLEEGTKRWEDRQIRWQNTMNSKPQDEIDDINRRKSSGIGRYLDRNISGKLYYIHFYNEENEFWKIGITSNKNIFGGRFASNEVFAKNHNLKQDLIFTKEFETIQEAYEIEQQILKLNNSNRITIDYNTFYSTECFKVNILKEINEIITIN